MFESVSNPRRLGRNKGAGTFVSLFLHGGAVLLALYLTTHKMRSDKTKEVDVKFVKAPPPPPPPPPAARRTQQRKVQVKPHPIVQQQIVQPKLTPPPEKIEDVPEPDEDDGVEGGVEGGVVGGVVGGMVGGMVGGTAKGPVEYNDTMVPPQKLSGPDPEYTDQALEHEVQGLMVVKCIVTTEGVVHDCRVVQGVPFMDRSVIEALQHRRYTPAKLSNGQPVEVDYTFRIRLTMPQ